MSMCGFEDKLRPDPLQPGISAAERAARAARYITGTAHPDPGWDGKLSLAKQHDQGVVVLDAAASTRWPGITQPRCPVGYLDRSYQRDDTPYSRAFLNQFLIPEPLGR